MTSRTQKLIMGLCSAFLLFASTSPVEAVVASVKALGMGYTGVANPQDALAGALNPAGIVDVCDRVDFGVSWAHIDGHATVEGNIIPFIPVDGTLYPVNGTFNATRTKNFYSPDFGIVKSMNMYGWDFSVGLVAYQRNFSKTTYNTILPLFGTSRPGLEYLHATVSPIIAVRWCDHSFGISLDYMFQRLKVNGLQRFDNAFRSSYPTRVTNNGYSWATGLGVTLGWKWDILSNLSFGVCYKPTTDMGRFNKYRGFLAQHGLLKIPQTATIGLTYRPICNVSLSFDLNYEDWKKVRSLHNPLEPNVLTSRLGENNGAGFGFRSRFLYRFGADWDINETWTVRAGFRLGPSFITPPNTAVNALTDDVVSNYVMCGFSWRPYCRSEISMWYGHGFGKTIHGKNSIPPGLPPFGLGGGEADIYQRQNILGISFGLFY